MEAAHSEKVAEVIIGKCIAGGLTVGSGCGTPKRMRNVTVRKCCQHRRVRGMNGGQKELGGNHIQCSAEEQRFEEAEKVTLGFTGGIIAYF